MPISAVQPSDCCTHIHPFFKCYFPLWFIPVDWIQFLVVYSRTLLLIHSKCNILDLPKFVFYHQFETNNSHDSLENLDFSRGPICHYTFPERKNFPYHSPWRKTDIACVWLFYAGNIWMKLRRRHVIIDFKKSFHHLKGYNLRQISQFIVCNTWSYITLL